MTDGEGNFLLISLLRYWYANWTHFFGFS